MNLTNYINGAQQAAISGAWLDVFEPASGKVFAQLPDSDERDVAAATAAAEAAFGAWSQTTPQHRHDILSRIAAIITARLPELAAAESRDNGKALWLAKQVDIPRAAANFDFFANAITQFSGETHETTGIALNYTLRQPIGVVGCISPWNLPLYLFTWKIAPALAAGNCVVAKPSEVTPLTAFLLGDICTAAGLPAGVLNIVHGLGHKVGAAMSANPKIKAISFTGSTRTGAEIARVAAPMFKKLSLELGGKNPNLIFADCNYAEMLRTTMRSSFANQGQICLCGSRIFVERPMYSRFLADFVAHTSALKVGHPDAEDTKVGAIVSEAHHQKIMSYIALAQAEGGIIACGGRAAKVAGFEGGWYIEPTIITGLPHDCRTNQEEIFGPVVTVAPFDTEEEVIAWANSTEYGLAATLWTENLSRTHRLARQLETGILWVNTWLNRDLRTPFGGVKNSGVGREGGFEALRFFTEAKNVCIQYL